MARQKNYAPDFKAKIALAALSGNKTVAELNTAHGSYQTQIDRHTHKQTNSCLTSGNTSQTIIDSNTE